MKKILSVFIIFCCISLIAQTKARVIGIKDGDTIVVLLGGNIKKTIRLAEVDCPEKGQPFGKNAKQFTADLVFSKEIIFVETDIDRYGRIIAKVYIKGKYLSREIIKEGLGWWYLSILMIIVLGKLKNMHVIKKEDYGKTVKLLHLGCLEQIKSDLFKNIGIIYRSYLQIH